MQFKDIPLGVLSVGVTLFLAAIGATFLLTKNSYDQTIKIFEERVKFEEKKNSNLEYSINQASQGRNQNSDIFLPSPSLRMAQESGNSEIEKMAIRLEELEKERRKLLSEIANKSVVSLDPRSELSVLLSQLNSDNSEIEARALEGLLTLRDPLSVEPLVKYFKERSERNKKANSGSLLEWYLFFLKINEPAGIEFVVSELESNDRHTRESAFSSLKFAIDSVAQADRVTPYLEEVALRSDQSTVRVKAKVLLKEFKEKTEEVKLYEKLIEDKEVSGTPNEKKLSSKSVPAKSN